MGLDMYFYARKEKFSFTGISKETDIKYPKELKGLDEYISQVDYKSKLVSEDYKIGYFRKFNALHNYIVEHFADGVDECQTIYIDKDKITELLNVCNKVIENPKEAEKLLPTSEGFFFGSQEYDEYYFEDVKSAIELFNLILSIIDFDKWSIIYRASW